MRLSNSSINNKINNNIFNNTDNFIVNDSNTNYWNITKMSGINIIGGPNLGATSGQIPQEQDSARPARMRIKMGYVIRVIRWSWECGLFTLDDTGGL